MSLIKHLMLAAALAVGGAGINLSAQAAGPVAGQGTWQTTLKARDAAGHAVALDSASAEFFYDVVTNVTWLADMNAGGQMDWPTAKAWARGLNLGGHSDWRLPNIIDSGSAGCDSSYSGGTDCGYNVQTQVGGEYSEWAHLYYVTLGNKAFLAPDGSYEPDYGLTNTANFRNMQSFPYWSGTEYVAPATGDAWSFFTDYGGQSHVHTGDGFYAIAVRSGDVLQAGTVPEISTLLMTVAGLGVLGAALGRRGAC